MTAALDALARNHSNSRPQRRQCLVAHFAPLQQGFMGKFSACMYRLLMSAYRGSCAHVSGNSVCYLTKLVVSLSCALLQSLGKYKLYSTTVCVCLLLSCRYGAYISLYQYIVFFQLFLYKLYYFDFLYCTV